MNCTPNSSIILYSNWQCSPLSHPNSSMSIIITVIDVNVVLPNSHVEQNIQKLKYILRQRELSRHFQHQYCIAKAAQNWLEWICTLNCIFNAFLYTKYPHLSVSTTTCIYTFILLSYWLLHMYVCNIVFQSTVWSVEELSTFLFQWQWHKVIQLHCSSYSYA